MNTPIETDTAHPSDTSFGKRYRRVFCWMGGIAVFILVVNIIAFIGDNRFNILLYIENIKAERYEKQLQEQSQKYEQALRNDTYGGKTPEETFDLFLTALKSGDVELAVKYYKLDVQEKEIKEYREELEEVGNIDYAIGFYSNIKNYGRKTCFSETMCAFKYTYITDKDEVQEIKGTDKTIFVPKGHRESTEIAFELNPHTKLWKIL